MAVKMIDISAKPEVLREAEAYGEIRLKPDTIRRIRSGSVEKGDPVQISTIAGINAVKMTHYLMPLCHPLKIEASDVKVEVDEAQTKVRVRAKVRAVDKTGVEMEALTAVAVALLNVWDVVKQYEKDKDGQYLSTSISEIKVLKKVKRPLGSSHQA